VRAAANILCGAGSPNAQSPVPDIAANSLYVDVVTGQVYAVQGAGVWVPVAPAVLASSGMPVILVPNGTIATNGSVTLGTALPVIFPQAWCFFPAGAVVGGLAGLYYVTFSSTTVGQVYTNYADASLGAFRPTVPVTLVAAVGSNSAYTQTTGSDITLVNTALPGGAMGANGCIRKTTMWAVNNTGGNKTAKLGFSGGLIQSTVVTTSTATRIQVEFKNLGDVAHQTVYPSFGSVGTTTGALVLGTVNTANPQNIVVTAQIAVATDYCALIQNLDELIPAV
jgi:hypothetical protein